MPLPLAIFLLVALTATSLVLGLLCLRLTRRLGQAERATERALKAWGEVSKAISEAVEDNADSALCRLARTISKSLKSPHVFVLRKLDDTIQELYPAHHNLDELKPCERSSCSFFWSERPLVFDRPAFEAWLPSFKLPADDLHGLFCRVGDGDALCYLLVLRPKGDPAFSKAEAERMQRILRIANVLLLMHAGRKRIAELEQQVAQAREEGMLEISTGVIHNVANAITPIDLALQGEGGKDLEDCLAGIGYVNEQLANPDDDTGLDPCAVLEETAAALEKHADSWTFAADKIQEVSELIALQQRYIGELGTEGIVSIDQLVQEIQRLCVLAVESHGLSLKIESDATKEFLGDAAELRFMILRMIKVAVESCDAAGCSGDITIRARDCNSEDAVQIEIEDQAPGYYFKENGSDSRTREYLTSQQSLVKYDAKLEVQGGISGTRVRITLPVYQGK